MLKPGGSLSFAVGSLSGAEASGGPADQRRARRQWGGRGGRRGTGRWCCGRLLGDGIERECTEESTGQ